MVCFDGAPHGWDGSHSSASAAAAGGGQPAAEDHRARAPGLLGGLTRHDHARVGRVELREPGEVVLARALDCELPVGADRVGEAEPPRPVARAGEPDAVGRAGAARRRRAPRARTAAARPGGRRSSCPSRRRRSSRAARSCPRPEPWRSVRARRSLPGPGWRRPAHLRRLRRPRRGRGTAQARAGAESRSRPRVASASAGACWPSR